MNASMDILFVIKILIHSQNPCDHLSNTRIQINKNEGLKKLHE